MSEPKLNLLIVSPDSFYAMLLKQARFAAFDSRVVAGINEVETGKAAFQPSVVVIFGAPLTQPQLSETVLHLRGAFGKAKLLVVDGRSSASIHRVWPTADKTARSVCTFTDVESLNDAILQLMNLNPVVSSSGRKLSNSQLMVLQAVACGQSNAEIAQNRQTTVRAVENLTNRAFSTLGLTGRANRRARIVAAQKHLAEMGIDISL